MPETKVINPAATFVEKVTGGYRVSIFSQDGSKKLVPVPKELGGSKVYFHPTSAYSAMGRLLHDQNVKGQQLPKDPSKAPKKEEAA